MNKHIINQKRLNALYGEIAESIEKNNRASVFSIAHTQRMHMIAYLGKRTLLITNSENLNKSKEILSQLGVKTAVLYAQNDVVLNKHGTEMGLLQQRIRALADWVNGKISVLIVAPETLLQYLPSIKLFKTTQLKLSENDNINLDEFAKKIVKIGYRKANRAFERGTFAILGDIIEVFPLDFSLPVRISLDFEKIESIRLFQPETMAGGTKLKQLLILPATDFLAEELNTEKIFADIRKSIGLLSAKASQRTEEILADLAYRLNNEMFGTLAYLTPFVKDKMSTLFDYVEKEALIVFDEPNQIFSLLNTAQVKHRERVLRLAAEGEALKAHLNSILSVEAITEFQTAYRALSFSNYLIGQNDSSKGFFVINSTNLPLYFKDINLLIKDVYDYYERDYEIVLFSGSNHWKETIKRFFPNINISHSSKRLDRGFICKATKSLVVGTLEMNIKAREEENDPDMPLPERRAIAPKEGDYVVHEEYGIGKCLGITHVKNYVGENDYLLLQYADNNKIYIPVHQMDMLHLYSGGEVVPKLSNPNKEDFKEQKERARKSIKKLAVNLLELYAKREKAHGYKYPLDTSLQKEFEAEFEFEETRDQLKAVKDIKSDMEKGRVMDRLICGDVGFGKTEVALRAIFKTVMENKQAAVLAPTTILAEQHFITMSSRFQRFGINIACLTRFRSKAEKDRILEDTKNGAISVIIGTHRILSKDVVFFDLGLLVLDEEQRFGVEHKEKIKALRSNINVLSLSATPIPRTLHMALSGIRDVSILDIPPKGRHPVKTIVAEYSEALLMDAVMEEYSRGGQIFVMYNRIDRIDAFADTLKRLFPALKIVIGHGRMRQAELEENIYKFYNKEADILLSTTIIENGIDIPNANTLFVLDADRLGLAQMYQLKGRVGRSTRIASAYFTYFSEIKIFGNVQKRLDALLDNTELGSGYRLAMMDLEIRGAGNVLGKEQHGHVEKIGYDMYCKLLKNTIQLLSGQPVSVFGNTEVSIKADAFISSEYVKSEIERLKLYKRIAEIKTKKDREVLRADIEDIYGKIPVELKNLLDISLIRALGATMGVEKIIADANSISLIFEDGEYLKSVAIKNALFSIKKEIDIKVFDDKKLNLCNPKRNIYNQMQILIKFLLNANGFSI